jgi:hypothetical protein
MAITYRSEFKNFLELVPNPIGTSDVLLQSAQLQHRYPLSHILIVIYIHIIYKNYIHYLY